MAAQKHGRDREIWKPIPGADGYEASSWGRIRSIPRKVHYDYWKTVRGRIMRFSPHPSGHLMTHVGGPGVPRYVHQLVMLAFRGACPAGMEVLHGDDNPANNELTNLRYGTRPENLADRERNGRSGRGSRNGMSKLTAEAVKEIRRGGNALSLARKYGISFQQVYRIRARENWDWLHADD